MVDIVAVLKPLVRGKTVLAGIGNTLKGDDAIGPEIVRSLEGKVKVPLIDCGSVPENFTRKITELSPDTLIIIDAANWGGKAGEARLISVSEISSCGFSTHDASLEMFVNYLKSGLPGLVNVVIIGIQPAKLDFGEKISPEVSACMKKISSGLRRILNA